MSLEFLEPSLKPWERAVHEVLEDWFNAMEDGSAFYRLPDLAYTRPDGKAVWTDAELDNLVNVAIDEYVDRQRGWIKNNRYIVTDAHCGFGRLETIQRIAFAQDLEKVFTAHGVSTGKDTAADYLNSGITWG